MSSILDKLNWFGQVEQDAKLAEMTTLKIGGLAHYVVYPHNFLSLGQLMEFLLENNIPYKLLGKGSNILCGDDYYDGVIIKLDRTFNDYFFTDNHLFALSGCSIIALAHQAMKESKSGLEFASGIPGTLGGCLFMNAGAYKMSMADIVEEVLVFKDNDFVWLPQSQLDYSYRHSMFQNHPEIIIVAAKLRLEDKPQDEIRSVMESRRERRMSTQPLDKPSAGSAFRNPDEMPAWQYIDQLNLRGYKIGGAKISDQHSNFIINDGGATASDFLQLTQLISDKIKENYNIEMKMEVEKFNCK